MQSPSADHLEQLRDLYERGLCLRAFELAQKFGDLTTWRSTEARVLAGRLAMNLGAGQPGTRLHLDEEDRTTTLMSGYRSTIASRQRSPLAARRSNSSATTSGRRRSTSVIRYAPLSVAPAISMSSLPSRARRNPSRTSRLSSPMRILKATYLRVVAARPLTQTCALQLSVC